MAMLTLMAVPAGYRKMVLCKVGLVARSAEEYCQLQSRIRNWKCAIESASFDSLPAHANIARRQNQKVEMRH